MAVQLQYDKPLMLEGRRKKRKWKKKGKGKRETARQREGEREEGKEVHLPVTEIPEKLPKRITAEVIVLLLFVENATQNESYFFNGRSSKSDLLLTSLYLTFLQILQCIFQFAKNIYHAPSLKKLFVSRNLKLHLYFYWK